MSDEAKDAALKSLWERIDGIEAGRQALIDNLWARIPAGVTDYGYTKTTDLLTVQPTSSELIRVRNIVCYVETTTGAVLTLGNFVFPVPSRFTNWIGLSITLRQSDKRQLKATSATKALGLIVCGEILPTAGHF